MLFSYSGTYRGKCGDIMEIIARIYNDFDEKFGVPRQAGLAGETVSTIIFEPEYRVPEALRGLEDFEYIWLLWDFSEAKREKWSPTVRPPRLGGNIRMGVFATRSPYRPNSIGLSSVKLIGIEKHPEYSAVLKVQGADLMNGTPIYDIKPYLPYTDSHPGAKAGFTDETPRKKLKVEIPDNVINSFPSDKIKALESVLAQDPRPAYIDDESRVFGIKYAGHNVKFTVSGDVLSVTEIE